MGFPNKLRDILEFRNMAAWDKRRKFTKICNKHRAFRSNKSFLHDYTYNRKYCDGLDSSSSKCDPLSDELPVICDSDGWRRGHWIIELGVLLDSLKFCKQCKLGPLPLTSYSLVDELKRGLGGYLYVRCMSMDCGSINRVSYGKTHRLKKKGMPCFVTNTKLDTGKSL